MKRKIFFILLIFTQISFSQTKAEIKSLLIKVTNEVKSYSDIISNENAKKIYKFEENAYEALNEFVKIKTKTHITSNCKKKDYLSIGDVAQIILNHIILTQQKFEKENNAYLKKATKSDIIELLKNNYWENRKNNEILKFNINDNERMILEYEKDADGEITLVYKYGITKIIKKRSILVLKLNDVNRQWKYKVLYITKAKLGLIAKGKFVIYFNVNID